MNSNKIAKALSFVWFRLRLSKPWKYKFPTILGLCYLMFYVEQLNTSDMLLAFALSILTCVGFAGIAYSLNDYSDQADDEKSGKPNSIKDLGKIEFLFLLGLFFVLAFLPWIKLPYDEFSFILIAFEILLFAAYSLKPIRLKERGFTGVLADSLYAHAIPAVLALYTFHLWGEKSFGPFFLLCGGVFVWQLISGIRNVISHQLEDRLNDQVSGTKTWVLSNGIEKSNALFKWAVIPLEVLAMIGVLAGLTIGVAHITFYYYIIFLIQAAYLFQTKKVEFEPKRVKLFTNEFLDAFYQQWLPYGILTLLCFYNLSNVLILAFHLLLFGKPIKNRFLGSILSILKSVKATLLFLMSRVRSNKGPRNSLANLAIVSPNYSKYSETFIQNQIRGIKGYNIFHYTNGNPPTAYIKPNRNKLNPLHSKQRIWSSATTLSKSFKKKDIELVLAQYGPTGVHVMDACKALQLPLVVHFHGYDAYRADVMENEGQHYPELFAIASKVIVVSKPMKEQLNKLGCLREKIALIPYGIDTKYFCKTKPEAFENNILFCGRLVEKKNPILALQVFQDVLLQIPDAQLTIAGDGPLRSLVESFIAENKLHKHVKMLGAVSSEEVKSQLNKSQVFFLPSGQSQDNDSEGTPVSILEASAMEVPIVSTFHAGIPEAVLNNKTGFLCENSATHQMAGRIIELLQNKSLAQEMGKAGRDHILKNYKRQKQLQKLSDVLSSV